MKCNNSYIYGKNALFEALEQNTQINKVLIQNGMNKKQRYAIIDQLKRRKLPYSFVEKSTLDEYGEHHQGVVAFTSSVEYAPLEEVLGQEGLVVILDGVTDTHNMGAIIRSAYAFGAKGVVLPSRRSASVDASVYKASAGAAFHLPIARVSNLQQAISKFKEAGYWVYGADAKAEKNIRDISFDKKTLLIVGSEGSGISKKITESCDFLFTIPMNAFDSLNVSVAAGIVFYEIYQQNILK